MQTAKEDPGQLGLDFVPARSPEELRIRVRRTLPDSQEELEALLLEHLGEMDALIVDGQMSAAMAMRARIDVTFQEMRARMQLLETPLHDFKIAYANRWSAPDGTVPKWGQGGDFVIDYQSNAWPEVACRVRVTTPGFASLGLGDSQFFDFAIYAVDWNKKWLWHTGARGLAVRGYHASGRGVDMAVIEALHQAYFRDLTALKSNQVHQYWASIHEPHPFNQQMDDPRWKAGGYLHALIGEETVAGWRAKAEADKERFAKEVAKAKRTYDAANKKQRATPPARKKAPTTKKRHTRH